MANKVHVVVAVIINAQRQVLLALRQAYQHQGNLWEFPGGKIEAGETAYKALKREIDEEIGLHIITTQPFMTVHHDYEDKLVMLDVWLVDAFSGHASGKENQTIRWCNIIDLDESDFPAANASIVQALKLRVEKT